ncbi:hypothetical protein OF848_04660 [Heyndrickxia coagulans]|uniref:hypothetical protein n=1 Tax=Heyndrickxia coagulans TaxID=1398 RepID=UPI0021F15AA4|nr:hypothetical protein [Heyndrickxia coagulans]UYM82751.1 hypothetical protein OF848_04660 [Heyndrickxia coagulans]
MMAIAIEAAESEDSVVEFLDRSIIINVKTREKRYAVMENGEVSAIRIRQPGGAAKVGNIYLGKVADVKPGINARLSISAEAGTVTCISAGFPLLCTAKIQMPRFPLIFRPGRRSWSR